MVFEVFLPYIYNKLEDYISRYNWSDPNKRRGTFK